ncbi:MAG: S-layer homology domain-containing protein, partial [Actinobacteria bacterium]|nr:S-layer homology domain-containing protein [Actinomycetota bacterium]
SCAVGTAAAEPAARVSICTNCGCFIGGSNKVLLFAVLTVVGVFLLLVATAYAGPTTFPDVVGHWAQAAIEEVASLGLMRGHDNGTFGPDEWVSRGQLATVLANDLSQRPAATNTLIDQKLNTNDQNLALWKIQPGLGTVMIEYGNRMARLWFAGSAGNWDMATYQIAEMREIQETGEITRPNRADPLKAFEANFLDPVDTAAKATDATTFVTAFNAMIDGCNGCHVAASSATYGSYQFVKVQIPKTDPADYLQWNVSSQPNHVAGANCAQCHSTEQAAWVSPPDKHAASATDVLLNTEHNQAEGLPPANGNPANDCLLCHSPFQAKNFTIGDFVQPLNAGTNNGGPLLPDGSWSLQAAAGNWQATKCEVCHDPTAGNSKKLAKYDGDTGTYQDVTTGSPVSHVFSFTTKTYADVPVTAGLPAAVTTLCDSCHDPADQGGDDPPTGSEAYGQQGGDSRAFVTESHAGLGCNDCHRTHDFAPADPSTTPSCKGSSCHDVDRSTQAPGVVHVNHLP